MDRVEADHRIRVARETAQAKIDAATEIARRKELAEAERAIKGKQQTTLRWSVPPTYIPVTDEAAPQCPWVAEKFSRGGGLVVIISGDGTLTMAPRHLVNTHPSAQQEPWFPAWSREVAQRINHARQYHRGLDRVHNINTWHQIFGELCDTETFQSGWDGQYSRGVRDDFLVTVPTVTAIRVATDGLRIRVRPHRAANPARWNRAAPELTAALRHHGFTVGDLEVTAHPSGDLVLALNDTPGNVPEPAVVASPTGITPYDPVTGRSLLGVRVDDGSPAWLTWRGNSGCIVGGVPGSGKTGSLLPVIAGLAGLCELHVFDGKGSYDLAVFEPAAATYDRSMALDAPVATLEKLSELIELRATAIHTATGLYDFWAVPPADLDRLGLVPIFLIIDEAQAWLTASGLTAAEKKLVERISGLIRGLIQRGRFSGITTVLTTQRPSADIIPTSIRDIDANKLCFRTTTAAQAKTVLGDMAEDAPAPSTIPGSAKGRCVVVDDEGGAVLVQAGYADLKTLQARIGVRRPLDQFELAQKLAGGKG